MKSDDFERECGLFQGSILSPILFNLFIDELSQELETVSDSLNQEYLEETNENEIRYEYIIVETNGYKTVIMDFDNSYIDADVRYFWEEIMDVFEKITLY
jgi:hypothetical protein